MNSFHPMRRDFLRVGGLGMAGAALPAIGAGVRPGGSDLPGLHGAQGLFDVRQFGAAGDGKTLDTQAVNRAIEAAAAAGGGVVTFTAGNYLCFSIRLKSQVHLRLEPGMFWLPPNLPSRGAETGYNGGVYDAAEPKTAWDAYQDYGHNHWHNSLIWGEDLHDFSITGSGLIYGKGLSKGLTHAPRRLPAFKAEQAGVGNKAIALKNCRNVLLRDFSILKGGHFGLLLTGVDNLTIDNLLIDTDRDGMDIDCCQNVRVSNCTVNSPWDDGICPKSSYALGYARPTRNMTITNCWVPDVISWVRCWMEASRSSRTEDARPGTPAASSAARSPMAALSISRSPTASLKAARVTRWRSVDGALLEDITITNTTMRDLVSGPIFMRLGARLRGPQESTKVGTLKRILISNLACYNAPQKVCSILSGIPGFPIEDVKLSNIYIQTVGGALEAAARFSRRSSRINIPSRRCSDQCRLRAFSCATFATLR